MMNAIESTNVLAQNAILVGTRMLMWQSEASALAAEHKVKPLSRRRLKRLCVLNSSVDTYAQFFDEPAKGIPVKPWVAKLLLQ